MPSNLDCKGSYEVLWGRSIHAYVCIWEKRYKECGVDAGWLIWQEGIFVGVDDRIVCRVQKKKRRVENSQKRVRRTWCIVTVQAATLVSSQVLTQSIHELNWKGGGSVSKGKRYVADGAMADTAPTDRLLAPFIATSIPKFRNSWNSLTKQTIGKLGKVHPVALLEASCVWWLGGIEEII